MSHLIWRHNEWVIEICCLFKWPNVEMTVRIIVHINVQFVVHFHPPHLNYSQPFRDHPRSSGRTSSLRRPGRQPVELNRPGIHRPIYGTINHFTTRKTYQYFGGLGFFNDKKIGEILWLIHHDEFWHVFSISSKFPSHILLSIMFHSKFSDLPFSFKRSIELDLF